MNDPELTDGEMKELERLSKEDGDIGTIATAWLEMENEELLRKVKKHKSKQEDSK